MKITIPRMTEKQLARNIVTEAKNCNWLVYHTFMSKWSSPGFPDLLMIRDGKILAWELKAQDKEASPAQREWLDAFALSGADARVVRPDDLEMAYKILVHGPDVDILRGA